MTGSYVGKPGAPPAYAKQWNAINWRHVQSNVNQLQVRIAKATKQKRWNRVKSLQHTLVTSYSAKLLAVREVTSKTGKNTPGSDGIVWKTAEAKLQAVDSLRRKGYKAAPLRRILIPKRDGKLRPLGIPTMKDRAMQALHAMALKPVAEIKADPHSYGFRPRRCVQDAVEQCFTILARDCSPKWVLEGDIRACFDQIDHQWMLENIPMDKFILRQWLEAGFIENHVFHETSRGTPQGGVASPILANLALDGMQDMIAKAVPKGSKVNFVRYADDFICTAKDPQILEDVIKPAIQVFLAKRGLQLSEEKTLITHIDRGFDFLGYNIRKYPDKKLLIKPRKENIKRFLADLKRCVRQLRYKKAHEVLSELNRKLIGWSSFFRNSVASKIFSSIDHHLFQTLWRELKRRHSKKSARWIKKTYFTSMGSNNWVFFGVESKGDMRRAKYLFQMCSCKIRRHVKVQSEATPFDPTHKDYFKKRARCKAIERNVNRLTKDRHIKIWRRYPKGQLELFEVGLREQPL